MQKGSVKGSIVLARENGLAQGLREGREEGREEEKQNLIITMHQNGMPAEQIAEMKTWSVNEVKSIVE